MHNLQSVTFWHPPSKYQQQKYDFWQLSWIPARLLFVIQFDVHCLNLFLCTTWTAEIVKKKHDGLDLRLILPAAYWLDWASAEMFLDLIWAPKHLVSKKYGPKNFGPSIEMPNNDFHTGIKFLEAHIGAQIYHRILVSLPISTVQVVQET